MKTKSGRLVTRNNIYSMISQSTQSEDVLFSRWQKRFYQDQLAAL